MRSDFFSGIDFIGYASGIAGFDSGAQDGPSAFFSWLETQQVLLSPLMIKQQPINKVSSIKNSLIELAKRIECSVENKRPFAVIGGDHSSGIGTWSGVANQLKEAFSLIWVDAHMDAHTMATSHSKNIHGMPVAHLLGKNEPNLKMISQRLPVILPEHLFLIGVRSYEDEEALFLRQAGVRIYFIEEVLERGIGSILTEVLQLCHQRTKYYGFSIDIDAFDPKQMPGTGLPIENGLCANEFLTALSYLKWPTGFLGLEIAEYNPHHDMNSMTAVRMYQILNSVLSFALSID